MKCEATGEEVVSPLDFPEEVGRLKAENERLRRIVSCVVRSCRHIDDTRERDEPGPMTGPTWAKVVHVCGLGSTSAAALCREFEVDPDYDCSREDNNQDTRQGAERR